MTKLIPALAFSCPALEKVANSSSQVSRDSAEPVKNGAEMPIGKLRETCDENGDLGRAACVCGNARIRAQEADADVKSKIIALERLSKMQAYPAKDVKTLDRLLDRDFLSVNLEGRLETKADLLLFVQSADSLQYQIDEMVVRVHEETAVVTGLYQLKGWVHGLPILQRGRFVDTWLLKDGQWAAIASLSTPAK
jgi:hypothetical protein